LKEQVESLISLGWSVWRYRWLAAFTAWAVGAASAAFVMSIPNRYDATARIFVDTQTVLRPLMTGIAVQPNIEQQVAMLGRTLISRANVEKAALMAGIELSDGKGGARDRRIEDMTKALQIQSVGRDNLYILTYHDSTPERAKRVVDSMVAIFVQSSVGASRKDSDSAKAFIDDQIKAYQIKLEEAEARLKDFRIRNIDMQANDGRDTATRMAEIGTQLDAARLQMREAEQARDAARAALANEKGGPSSQLPDLLADATITPATPEIDARLDAQRRNLDSLLQRFTEQHPDVAAARRVIGDLEQQKNREVAALRAKAAAAPIAPQAQQSSLAYQELTRMAAAADVQLAAARARAGEYQSRMELVRGRLKDAPRVEAELTQLNRDYGIQKRAYEELVARRESASMYGKLDDAAGLADFRVVDAAQVPQKPAFPNRSLMLLGALVFAVAAGLGAAVVMAQAKPVFHRASDLHARLSLPLLGAVAAVRSEVESRRERWEIAKLSVASASLVVLFIVGASLATILRA
jgi:polysaccharide chain length determinant protein (PEP-CTERM system associated)